MEKKIKICGISTLPNTVRSFMLNNFNYVSGKGFICYCITQPDNKGIFNDENLGNVTYIPIPIKWGYVSPFSLIKTIWRLYKIFRKEKFDIIQYATMNAALCASIAGWLAKVPVRIDLFWGVSFVNYTGWKKRLDFYAKKLICKLSTHVQPDSNSNLTFCRNLKLFDSNKSEVLFNGSACGVDLKKYDYFKREEWRKEIYDKYLLIRFTKIYGFVGRVCVNKGINELLEAFFSINKPDICLMLVGSREFVSTLNQNLYNKALETENIIFTDLVPNAAKYYAAFDYLLLPSYVEGFGMVVLEAAAVGTPAVVSNINGPTDFVKDGINGLICEPHSSDSLKDALSRTIKMTENEYKALADNAYANVKNNFDSEMFKERFYENRVKLYNESIKNKKR